MKDQRDKFGGQSQTGGTKGTEKGSTQQPAGGGWGGGTTSGTKLPKDKDQQKDKDKF